MMVYEYNYEEAKKTNTIQKSGFGGYDLYLIYHMNKKIFIILGIIVWAIYVIGNIGMALRLNFPDIKVQSFANKFSLVHFMAPGNDFVGSTFWLASKSIPAITINLENKSKVCTKQIRWLYFNSQRGKRLRPLDSETLSLLQKQKSSYNNLSITGWLYTTCEDDAYSVFWAITYIRSWNTSHLVAGTNIHYQQNKIIPQFAKNLQYFDNKVLIGYLYDSNGGIGYVGGSLTGHENLIHFLNTDGSINEGFTYSWENIVSSHPNERQTNIERQNNAMETMRNLIIQGSVGLSKSINEAERLSLLGNFQDKTLMYNGGDINSSTLINVAKKNAQKLCQGKERYEPNSIDKRLWTYQGNVVCIENKEVNIDLTDAQTYKNKTIIVKNGNVILEGWMVGNSPPLNLFIDKWVLYLPEPITREAFDGQWFPTQSNSISSWLYLKGNFIINGLVLPAQGKISFDHKLHLQGKITLLNTPLEASQYKAKQIEKMFPENTSTNGEYMQDYNNFINLQKVFTRTCGLDGNGSDETPCGTGGVIATTPLVILNGNYSSVLLQ